MPEGHSTPGGQHKSRATKFSMMAPNVQGSSIRNLIVTLLASRILWWLLNLWKVCAFLLSAMDPINYPSKYCRRPWLRPFNVCNTKLADVLGVCVFPNTHSVPSTSFHPKLDFLERVTDVVSSQSQKHSYLVQQI